MNLDAPSPSIPLTKAVEALGVYYAEPAVRERIVEFLGGRSLREATCEYITGDDPVAFYRRPRPVSELWECLAHHLDINRALWDRESLIAHLDVEYVNFDRPAEVYQHPVRAFELQQPVAETILDVLRAVGVHPLHVLSGRGHHFVWSLGRESGAFQQLASLGSNDARIVQNIQPHPPAGRSVSPKMGAAFAGLGRVMEFLAHRVKELAARRCLIPLEFTAVEAGPRLRDREVVSIDLSEYGDPLHTRALRVPFSVYHKPAQQRWLIGEEVWRALPPVFFVPLQDIGLADALQMRSESRCVAEFARRTSAKIPVQEEGMEHLLRDYLASPLAEFHRWFYSQEPHPAGKWAETYDRTPLEVLPKCARLMLDHPNDLLLHPASMRLITRVFLALGWHPRHIAGLITSKFSRDHGWGAQWLECDPSMRADFYTRIFAGLFVAGHDDCVDFNCQSSQEEKTCPFADCPHNLAMFRQSALARRQYDQLAHRPFHRLFLPT